MSKRLALLAAASPLALLAAPAQGQVDDRYAEVEEVFETYSEPVVQDIGSWESEESATGANYSHGDYGVDHTDEEDWVEESPVRDGHGRHHAGRRHGGPHGMAQSQPRQLAYSPAERAEWLSQCRALHVNYDEPVYVERDRDGNEEMIGSVLGAAAGGVIGHEVARRGDRLAGTLIGAGLGGLAGAVVGAVIDGFGDDEDERYVAAPQEPGFDYCEAYLINYERGYGTPQMAYAPAMIVPVAQGSMMQGQMMQGHGGARRVIVEEIEVEADEAPAPRHHRARRVIHRQPEGDKRVPIR